MSAKKASRGLRSNPKTGGMMPRNRFRYGSVMAKTGWRAPMLWAWGNHDRRMRAVMTAL